jgi:hypothetical protein
MLSLKLKVTDAKEPKRKRPPPNVGVEPLMPMVALAIGNTNFAKSWRLLRLSMKFNRQLGLAEKVKKRKKCGLAYILQQNKRTTGGKGQESGKRSRSEKTAKQWKPFLYKPRP